MGRSGPILEYGRAVDNENTFNHHQIFNASYDAEHGLYRVHYSVRAAEYEMTAKELVPDGYIELVGTGDLRLLKPKKQRDALELHKEFSMNFGSGDSRRGFSLGVPQKALTYYLNFHPNGKFHSLEEKVTLAVMKDKMDYEQARKKVKKNPPDQKLVLWHDIIARHYAYVKNKDVRKCNMNFGRVTAITTSIIERHSFNYNAEKGIDTVYRSDYCDTAQHNVTRHVYGNVLEETEPQIFMENKKGLLLKLNPGTANRTQIHRFNIYSATEFDEINHKNVFPVGVAAGMANIQRYLAA